MDISDLKAFVMLAETLNFTRSAEAMFVSQSTFSRQISRLESEMGTPLFVRSPRSVELTEYGTVFLPEARAQIAFWEKTLLHMAQVKKGLMGGLTIGFLQDNPNDLFPAVLKQYREKYPNVELILREFGQAAITQAVSLREIDVAFTFDEGMAECPGVSTMVLERSPICAVLREDHPLCAAGSVSLKALGEMPLVVIGQDVNLFGYQDVMDRCRRGGFTPKVAATANIIPSLFMLVEASLGFAFLPLSAKRIAPADICFLPIRDCSDEISTVLAWREDNGNPCLKGFLEMARALPKEKARE